MKLKAIFYLLLLLLLGLGIRIVFILHNQNLAGDEAVYGLMAKHIVENGELPVYFWGRPLGGSLIAYLGSLVFYSFGVSGAVFKLGMLFLAIPAIYFVYLLVKGITQERRSAFLAALFYAIPPVFVMGLSISPCGQYAEILFFTPLILYLCYRASSDSTNSSIALSAFVWGIALWTTFLVLPVVIFSILLLRKKAFSQKPKVIAAVLFFALGFSPALIYNFFHPGEGFIVFSGRFLDLPRAVLAEKNYVQIIFIQSLRRFAFWFITILRLPTLLFPLTGAPGDNPLLIFLVYLIYGLSFLVAWQSSRSNRKVQGLFWLAIFILIYGSIPGMGRSRHYLALYSLIGIFLVFFVNKIWRYSKLLAYATLSFILVMNLSGIVQNLNASPLSYEPLVNFLLKNRLNRGYADYWVAYPLVFASKEKIIISPTLFHPTFFEQYPQYTKEVTASSEVFYLFDTTLFPKEITHFEEILRERKISFQRSDIDRFRIYYSFSQRIYPHQMNYLQTRG